MDDIDKTGLLEPTSLAELRDEFEPCGGFLRRKGCTSERPSIVLDAADVLRLALRFAQESPAPE